MNKAPVVEFLKHVLGEDGYRAFEKANARVPTLGAVLAPRTIVGWLTTAIRVNYEGQIPGVDNSYISIEKSDRGFTGAVTIEDQVHGFQDTDILHVASAVAVALGVQDIAIHPMLKNTDISKLGKSIDMLVKVRVIAEAQLNELSGESASEESEEAEESIDKVELPGNAAAPKAPKSPDKPQTPTAVAPSTNRTVKPPMAKTTKEIVVKKSEADAECPECGLRQFRGDRFVGCMCFRSLAKNTNTSLTKEGDYFVRLGSDWDQETAMMLIEALK